MALDCLPQVLSFYLRVHTEGQPPNCTWDYLDSVTSQLLTVLKKGMLTQDIQHDKLVEFCVTLILPWTIWYSNCWSKIVLVKQRLLVSVLCLPLSCQLQVAEVFNWSSFQSSFAKNMNLNQYYNRCLERAWGVLPFFNHSLFIPPVLLFIWVAILQMCILLCFIHGSFSNVSGMTSCRAAIGILASIWFWTRIWCNPSWHDTSICNIWEPW